ncbi:Intraflagellar transport protein 80 [Rhizophlyctis rosea]|nr:Intraflagellar transport protein 80 [Rhizophlyctis rosea]
MDYKFIVWYYPNVVFVDEDIAPLTRLERDGSNFGKNAQIMNFIGTQCTVRRADGANVTVSSITPLPGILQEHARKKQWEEAIRLCRYVKMNELWACLAAMAIYGQDLNTAEVAYAAIDEVQKVEYVCYIRDIPTPEGRSAELALLRHQHKEAETILLSANMIYRAIRMWLNLFNWDRALEIAVKYKTHVDTVLYFRDKYLRSMGRKETSKRFLQYAQGARVGNIAQGSQLRAAINTVYCVPQVTVDYEKIKAKLAMEEEAEKTRSSARPYQ